MAFKVILMSLLSWEFKALAVLDMPSWWFLCIFLYIYLVLNWVFFFFLARYRNQTSQAESYYRHAAQLVPSNGEWACHFKADNVTLFFIAL